MIKVVNLRYETPTVVITRPTVFANPYSHLLNSRAKFHVNTREDALEKFIEYWYAPEQKVLREATLRFMPKDATLGCVCSPKSCHGDVIAGYINWKRSEIK